MSGESSAGSGDRARAAGRAEYGDGGLRQLLQTARSHTPNEPPPPPRIPRPRRAPADPVRQQHAQPADTAAFADAVTQEHALPHGFADQGGAAPTEPMTAPQAQHGTRGSEPHAAPRPPAPRRPGERRPISRSQPEPGRGEFLAKLKSPMARRAGIAAGAVLGLAALGYVADLAMSSGEVPRGVVVAGIDIGGMDIAAADARLRTELDGRADRELPVRIADVRTTVVPSEAGLGIDWDGTWERIGGQPLNPIARVVSLFGTRNVPVASTVDDAVLDRQLDELRVHDQPTVEGTVVFVDVTPVAVDPVPGRVLDLPAARSMLIERWVAANSLQLPVTPAPLTVRPEAIDQALRTVAEPAVAAPVVFTGKDSVTATLDPVQIASIVSFAPDGKGGLAVQFDHKAATDLLAPQLAESEIEPKDASFTLSGGAATVVPAVVGEKINWPKTLEQLPALLAAPTPDRTAQAVYDKIPPKLTTEAAEGLGITEPMAEFTTSGFSGPSGVNIRTVAREVNGAVVNPGETFSLNGHTGTRGVAEGYVESGIIDHGRPSTAVGGGISQFATTLYNAAYFAGLEDAGHTEHSYYISRYPAAREATVFDGVIDLQFRNNTPHGIYIEAFADSSEVTVRIWGTKTVDVESITGERTKPTEPKTITLPKGDDCIATEGAPGFTISDTRVITDIATGREISRNTRTVKYDPIPIVKCE